MTQSWKFYTKLNQKKYRSLYQLYIVEGIKLCYEALLTRQKIETVFVTQTFLTHPSYKTFETYFSKSGLTAQILSDINFKRLANTEKPQGILFVLKIPSINQKINHRLREHPFILLLEGISDPGNLGTIVRTADWFGIKFIYSSDSATDFFNPKVVRASMGSIFRIHLEKVKYLTDIMVELKKMGFTLVSSDPKTGVCPEELMINTPIGLILGSEAHGISSNTKKMADIAIRIPKYGEAESLNVAVAAGILINIISKQLAKIG